MASLISLGNNIPGIGALFTYNQKENRPEITLALSLQAHVLLHTMESPLTQGERELIASYVSFRNGCDFCSITHGAVAKQLLDNPDVVDQVKQDFNSAALGPKMKALLKIADKIRGDTRGLDDGNQDNDVIEARAAGATDRDIHDTILIAASFCLYNRYVQSMGGECANRSPADLAKSAPRLARDGYLTPEELTALQQILQPGTP